MEKFILLYSWSPCLRAVAGLVWIGVLCVWQHHDNVSTSHDISVMAGVSVWLHCFTGFVFIFSLNEPTVCLFPSNPNASGGVLRIQDIKC